MILKNPGLVIFDELFSNLDSESETKFFENINEIFKGKTKIIISHRLSSVISADRIIYLENGKVVEIAAHKFLMEKHPKYRELWKNQIQASDREYEI
ncbi:MAG: hypothetical protein A2087_03820 [Spirochaetes bacterium GWD1_61_31]|nr:MAG: hypothetical protein A2087_03820 [Spirochaetes bacterium GWD1_61_31]OHD46114.1 MAG: hypothetical protein A2Y35_09520 [Spirochaetes bacterium GWE1_60_18]